MRGAIFGRSVPVCPVITLGFGDEVLAPLVSGLRGELADSQAALAQALTELRSARQRIAELEARLNQTPRNSSKIAAGGGAGQAAAAVAAQEALTTL